MGSSWALVFSTAFVWVILGSASGDQPFIEQREINYADALRQDSSMLQRPMDMAEFFQNQPFIEQRVVNHPDALRQDNPDALLQRLMDVPEFVQRAVRQEITPRGHQPFIEQREINYADALRQDLSMLQRPIDVPEFIQRAVRPEMTPRGRRPHFAPAELYPVQFPLGRPTSENLQAICLNGDRRPRYPKSYFPDSGFGSQSRKGSAVNKAEASFTSCCKGNQTWTKEVTLCCLTRAWKHSIQAFCREEHSIKTRPYHCCTPRGAERLTCFDDNAPNPNYEATEEIPVPPLHSKSGFKFDPSVCRRYAGEIRAV